MAGLLLLLLIPHLATADETRLIAAGDTQIPISHYAARGSSRIVWLPSEYGVLPEEQAVARRLARKGIEVWVADLYGARFLPTVASSAEALAADDVFHVLEEASRDGRRLWLVSAGRGAKVALEGARLWQQRKGKTLAGIILLYPNLYAGQPEPGEDPAYLPITTETRQRIYILQGELSPWYWTLDSLVHSLQQGGSRVTVQTFPGIRDRFHFRPHATPAERALGERLPNIIARLVRGGQPRNAR